MSSLLKTCQLQGARRLPVREIATQPSGHMERLTDMFSLGERRGSGTWTHRPGHRALDKDGRTRTLTPSLLSNPRTSGGRPQHPPSGPFQPWQGQGPTSPSKHHNQIRLRLPSSHSGAEVDSFPSMEYYETAQPNGGHSREDTWQLRRQRSSFWLQWNKYTDQGKTI